MKYVTTFVGGGAPRFWFSVSPQLQQLNYAQIIMEVTDKEVTGEFVQHLQPIVSAKIPGARIDVRQLQYAAIDFPLDILISNNADVSARSQPRISAPCGGWPDSSKTSSAPFPPPPECAMTGTPKAPE